MTVLTVEVKMSEEQGKYTKSTLRKRMDDGLAAFLSELDRLSEAQMTEPKDAAGWNVRDHLTHIITWMDGITALMRRENRWAAMGLPGEPERPLDFDKINAQIVVQHRHLTPAEARARLVESHRKITAAMEALDENELDAPYDRFVAPFTGSDGRPIVSYILGDTVEHYEEHLVLIRALTDSERI